MKTMYITRQGAEKLESKISALNIRIKEIQEEKAVAYWGSGDGWHDNPGFNQLEQLEHRTINEMVKLNNQLRNSALWDPTKNDSETVLIGSQVEFEQVNLKTKSAVRLKVTIVGYHESDLKKMWISYDSPIGSALYKKKVGEECFYTIPAGEFQARIISISTNNTI